MAQFQAKRASATTKATQIFTRGYFFGATFFGLETTLLTHNLKSVYASYTGKPATEMGMLLF